MHRARVLLPVESPFLPSLPLPKHSLNRTVHLGVLVVLGGHQELLNIPPNNTMHERVHSAHRHQPFPSPPGPKGTQQIYGQVDPWPHTRRPVFKQEQL